MSKSSLYREMIKRLEHAVEERQFFEASWYAYAILEDRLISLIVSSGSSLAPNMMGPKIKLLEARAQTDLALAANFEMVRLNAWKRARNNLMHAMADGTMSIDDIDIHVAMLATEGAELVRIYSAAARRHKKQANRTR
jgi:hypothetical protein